MIQRHDSLIVQKIAPILIPLIQLFAVYVLLHGHYSPGGGFQAGVLIGASLILKLLVGGSEERKQFSIRSEFLLAVLGVGLFLTIGATALLEGGRLFDYGVLAALGETIPDRRYWSILIAEIGITLTVSMTLVVIFYALAITPEE